MLYHGIKTVGQFTDFPAAPFVYPRGKISFPGFCHLQGKAFERRGDQQEERIDQKERKQPDDSCINLYIFFQLLDFHIDQLLRNQTDKGDAGDLAGCACHDVTDIPRI